MAYGDGVVEVLLDGGDSSIVKGGPFVHFTGPGGARVERSLNCFGGVFGSLTFGMGAHACGGLLIADWLGVLAGDNFLDLVEGVTHWVGAV